MKWLAAGTMLCTACGLSAMAAAQSGAPYQQAQSQQGQSGKSSQTTAQKAPAKAAPAAAAKSGGDSPPATGSEGQLRQRVEQLEEQVIDMQVVMGTLESLGRSGGGGGGAPARAASSSFSGPEAGRIAALETQLQALTAQVEQMSDQLRALRAGNAATAANTYRSIPNAPAAPAAGGFGPATVSSGASDPIGQLITTPPQRQAAAQPTPVSAAPAAAQMASTASSRQLYEQSYGQLLQQNYPAAEAGFAEFLQRFPGDELAANAQFWLGETYFVRGQWEPAGEAFLKVVKSYGNSVKAPDSLAKLAMTFERKGNKPAACRALAELNSRYPSPPAHVKNWEATERRRAGCA